MDAPLGIFDSGVGGLTVVRSIMAQLPGESIVYLGDTARVPYGTKSGDTVIRYALGCARVLVERGVKLLVVACNTASAYALDALRDELDIPVIGVIEPGARRAVQTTRSGVIGVIGTVGTIRSGRYQAAIHALAAQSRIVCKPCPMFVPLAEEGWVSGDVPAAVAREYMTELRAEAIDTLLLGCTHYPLLKDVIAKAVGPAVQLVDSADATAEAVTDTLRAMHCERTDQTVPEHTYLVTDDPVGFATTGLRFLGHELDRIEWVDVA